MISLRIPRPSLSDSSPNRQRVFNALIENPDFEYLIIDSTIVRAHQHAAGAKGEAKMRRSGVRAAA
jgi:putative transposase